MSFRERATAYIAGERAEKSEPVANPVSDYELKAMRDAVYGEPISDSSWNYVRSKWRNDEAWLTARFKQQRAL